MSNNLDMDAIEVLKDIQYILNKTEIDNIKKIMLIRKMILDILKENGC